MKFTKDDPVWQEILEGKRKHKFSNYVIQIKINHLQRLLKMKAIRTDQAINELYQIYEKYYSIFDREFSKYQTAPIKRKSYSVDEVKRFIKEGRLLVLAGDEKILNQLPEGNWIAGTTPYFMDPEGGIYSKDLIFVDDFTHLKRDFKIKKYTKETIENIGKDSFDNGFTFLLIPAFTDVLTEFAYRSFYYENIFNNPVLGYVTGFDLNGDNQKAYVYSGLNNEKLDQEAVALHVKIDDKKLANIEIINIFSQDENSPTLVFPKTDFVQDICLIDGKEENLADYLIKNNIDIRFPIIEEQNGALINKSFMKIDEENKQVIFYAPIFHDVEYRFAKPITNYAEKFNIATANVGNVDYSCNCILNYLYGELEGQKINISGATTFGEIAYQLLNQTQIYLKING